MNASVACILCEFVQKVLTSTRGNQIPIKILNLSKKG